MRVVQFRGFDMSHRGLDGGLHHRALRRYIRNFDQGYIKSLRFHYLPTPRIALGFLLQTLAAILIQGHHRRGRPKLLEVSQR